MSIPSFKLPFYRIICSLKSSINSLWGLIEINLVYFLKDHLFYYQVSLRINNLSLKSTTLFKNKKRRVLFILVPTKPQEVKQLLLWEPLLQTTDKILYTRSYVFLISNKGAFVLISFNSHKESGFKLKCCIRNIRYIAIL